MNANTVDLMPITVAMVRHVGPDEELNLVFDQLWEWVNQNAVLVGRTIGVFWDNPDYVSQANLRSGACVEVAPGYQISNGGGLKVGLDKLAGGSYVTTRYVGPHEDLTAIWSNLTQHIESTLRRRIRKNPAFEVYVNDASDTPASQLITDLYMPVD